MMRRGALLGLVLLMVGLFAALSGGTEPVAAQSGPVLVSNIGQTDGNRRDLTRDYAQEFRTGAATSGYTLNSVDWEWARVGSGDRARLYSNMSVTIRSDNGSQPGTTVVGTLKNPDMRPTGSDRVFTFTAPGAGIQLAPNTDYWIVLDAISGRMGGSALRTTASDAEDTGGAPGFSIANGSRERAYDSDGPYTQYAEAHKIRLNGSDNRNRPRLRLEYDPFAFPGQPIELKVVWDSPLTQSMQLLVGVVPCEHLTDFGWCTSDIHTDSLDYTDPMFSTFTMNAGQTEHTVTVYAAEDGERHAERGTVTVRCVDTEAKCTGWIAPIPAYNDVYGGIDAYGLTSQQHVRTGLQFYQPLLIDPTRYYNAGEACSFAPAAFARNRDYSLILDSRGDPYVTERFIWCGEYSYLQGVKSSRSPAGQHYRGEFIEVLSVPNKVQTGDSPTDDGPQDDPLQHSPPVEDEPLQVQVVDAVNDDAQQQSQCATSDQALLAQVEAKTQDSWDGGRPDLLEMFTRSYDTMQGSGDYTTADIRARPDKQGAVWQANGPNSLWQSIYAELDRLETCRASE